MGPMGIWGALYIYRPVSSPGYDVIRDKQDLEQCSHKLKHHKKQKATSRSLAFLAELITRASHYKPTPPTISPRYSIMAHDQDLFGAHNIPFGVASDKNHVEPRCVTRYQDNVVFLAELAKAGVFTDVDSKLEHIFSQVLAATNSR